MSKSIDDLRETLFATLEAVKAGTIDLDKARAVNEIAGTIVASAKVEVDFLRITNNDRSEFFGQPADPQPTATPGINGVFRHRLQG